MNVRRRTVSERDTRSLVSEVRRKDRIFCAKSRKTTRRKSYIIINKIRSKRWSKRRKWRSCKHVKLSSTTSRLWIPLRYGSAHGPPRGPGHERGQSTDSGVAGAAHQAAYERVHGVVEDTEEEDRPGESQDAQFRDIETVGRRVETLIRHGEETVHRRGETSPRHAHEGAPRLQVPSTKEAEGARLRGSRIEDHLHEPGRLPQFPPAAIFRRTCRPGVSSSSSPSPPRLSTSAVVLWLRLRRRPPEQAGGRWRWDRVHVEQRGRRGRCRGSGRGQQQRRFRRCRGQQLLLGLLLDAYHAWQSVPVNGLPSRPALPPWWTPHHGRQRASSTPHVLVVDDRVGKRSDDHQQPGKQPEIHSIVPTSIHGNVIDHAGSRATTPASLRNILDHRSALL